MARRPRPGLPELAIAAAAVFLCSYTSWRPLDVLFTYSDALFLLSFALSLKAGRIAIAPFGALTPLWMGAMLCVLLGLFIGSMTATEVDRWLIAGTQYLFSFVLLPMIIVTISHRRWLILVRSLIYGVAAMELFGCCAYFGFHGTFEQYQRISSEFITGEGRLGAFLGDANWNAAIIALTIPFVLFLRNAQRMSLIEFLPLLGVLLTALLLTASVTGLASTLGGVIIFGLVSGARPSRKMVGIAVAAALLSAAAGSQLPHAFQRRIATAVLAGNVDQVGTFQSRMQLVEDAWHLAARTTWVGVGTDQFRRISTERAPVHNILLLLWTEGGALSLFGWALLTWLALLGGVLAFPADRQTSALALAEVMVFIIFSNAAPHMYARVWMVPVLLGIGPAYLLITQQRTGLAHRNLAPSVYQVRRWPLAARSGAADE